MGNMLKKMCGVKVMMLINIWLQWKVSGGLRACYQKRGKVECCFARCKGVVMVQSVLKLLLLLSLSVFLNFSDLLSYACTNATLYPSNHQFLPSCLLLQASTHTMVICCVYRWEQYQSISSRLCVWMWHLCVERRRWCCTAYCLFVCFF